MGQPDPFLFPSAVSADQDLRTNEEQTNAQKVLDGDIDPFINAFLKWEALGGRAREAAADATAIR